MSVIRVLIAACLAFLPAVGAAQEGERYVVVRGDTLWDIAEMLYDDPFQWPRIHELNKESVPNPHLISPNQTLLVYGPDGKVTTIKVAPKTAAAPKPKPEEKKEEPKEEFPEEIEQASAPQPEAMEPEAEEPAMETPEEPVRQPRIEKPEFTDYHGRILMAAGDSVSKMLLSQGDTVFVSLGEKDGLVPGDEMWIIKKVRRALNPRTRKPFWVVERMGKVRITSEIYDRRCVAKILYSKLPVDIGDGVERIPR